MYDGETEWSLKGSGRLGKGGRLVIVFEHVGAPEPILDTRVVSWMRCSTMRTFIERDGVVMQFHPYSTDHSP